jgi:hypothetical protein
MLSIYNVDCKGGTRRASPAGLGSLVDVTGIEPAVTPCLQSEWGTKSKSLFRLRLTRQIHQNNTPLAAPKLLHNNAFRLSESRQIDQHRKARLSFCLGYPFSAQN